MKINIILFSLVLLIHLAAGQSIIESPLVKSELNRIEAAERIEDIFEKTSEIQLSTSAESAISYITDMEIDAGGNFVIADGWQSRGVYIFSPDGEFLRELGKRGQGPGEYMNPVSVEISPSGEIWVADYGGNRINIYSKEFKFERAIIGKPRILYYLHLNSRDEIFMYRSTGNPLRHDTSDTIFRYDDQGNKISSFAPFPEEALKIKFWAVQDGMSLDKDDFVYEMNPLYYRINKFNPEGKLIQSFSRKTSLFRIVTKEGETPIIVYGPFILEKGLVIAHVNKHLEIYDTNGNFIAGGLPFSQRILCSHGNCLYAERWEEENKEEVQPNPKIICYRLK